MKTEITVTPEMAFKGIESRARQTATDIANLLNRTCGIILLPEEREKMVKILVLHTNTEWPKAVQYAVLCQSQTEKKNDNRTNPNHADRASGPQPPKAAGDSQKSEVG